MPTAKVLGAALGLAAMAPLAACEGLQVDRLYAVHLEEAAVRRGDPPALPLLVKVGGGNVNGPDRRLAELEMDTDAVHSGSASCHHGPPIASPVLVQARAAYTDREVRLELRWRDRTADTAPKRWERSAEGWKLTDGDQDGIAVIWSRTATPFGCQEACHMRDFAMRRGEMIDLRSMFLAEEGQWEEAWVWKPSRGGQALLLERAGFRTLAGEAYRAENSAAAADASLRPEARRAGTFGPGDRPVLDEAGGPLPAGAASAPAYVFKGSPGEGGLTATAEREGRGWRVVFTRALGAGARRQEFRPGGRYPFGVAVFDATTTDHHIARDTQVLELVAPRREAAPEGDPRIEGPGIL